MKVLAILGSRNPEGRTARATAALMRGLESEGATTEMIFLPALRLERCRQCDANGWGACRREGRCVIEDDFPAVAQAVRDADLVIFATPVYFGDLSESMRALLDRLRRVTRHEAVRGTIEGKEAVAICVAGGGGGGAPACTVSLEKTAATCGFDVMDTVAVRRQNLDLKTELLEATGRWLGRRARDQAPSEA